MGDLGLNINFDATEGMSTFMITCLMQQGRIALTEASLARSPIDGTGGPAIYGGRIVLDSRFDWDEAQAIADARGWGEQVVGWLEAVIDDTDFAPRWKPPNDLPALILN